MPSPIFTARARISTAQADKMLRCYAERRTPKDAAKITGMSLNTMYGQYGRIRRRLVVSGYYRDGAWSADEAGLAPAVSQALRERRGIRQDEFYPHAAEAIHWADEHPPGLTLKHLRKIIELTGPLDAPLELSDAETNRLAAYVRYARTELVNERAQASAADDEAMRPYAGRAEAALAMEWRAYRAATKKVERERSTR